MWKHLALLALLALTRGIKSYEASLEGDGMMREERSEGSGDESDPSRRRKPDMKDFHVTLLARADELVDSLQAVYMDNDSASMHKDIQRSFRAYIKFKIAVGRHKMAMEGASGKRDWTRLRQYQRDMVALIRRSRKGTKGKRLGTALKQSLKTLTDNFKKQVEQHKDPDFKMVFGKLRALAMAGDAAMRPLKDLDGKGVRRLVLKQPGRGQRKEKERRRKQGRSV